MQRQLLVKISLVITLFLWASAFVGIKVALIDYSPFALSVYRYIIASIILVGLALVVKIQNPQKKDIARLFVLGFIGIAAYNMALDYGEQTVSAGATSFIIKYSADDHIDFIGTFFKRENKPLWAESTIVS